MSPPYYARSGILLACKLFFGDSQDVLSTGFSIAKRRPVAEQLQPELLGGPMMKMYYGIESCSGRVRNTSIRLLVEDQHIFCSCFTKFCPVATLPSLMLSAPASGPIVAYIDCLEGLVDQDCSAGLGWQHSLFHPCICCRCCAQQPSSDNMKLQLLRKCLLSLQ